MDTRAFRNALGSFATGVTIVSGLDEAGKPVGSTVNSFNSVSLTPPLVLFSLARETSASAQCFGVGKPFVINVLAANQIDLSNHFAKRFDDKWTGIPYDVWDTGAPVVPGALASFEGEVTANHDGGDHIIHVGHVRRMRVNESDVEPLLYFKGRYAGVAQTDK